MATFQKRGDSWQARLCVKGKRESATFPDLARAKAWAAKVETELRAQARGEIIPRSVRQALERYGEHVSPLHRGCRWEQVRLSKIDRTLPFVRRRMQDVTQQDVLEWRDELLTTVATSSARREFGLLRAVFSLAAREWKWLHRSPFDGITPPAEGAPRKRRVSDAEIAAVCLALGYEAGIKPETASQHIGAACVLAVETAMRKGEILSLDAESRQGRVVQLEKTKNGDDRAVPLSTRAAAVMDLQPTDDFAFPVHSHTFDTLFRRARDGIGADWHFHDLRREATTRLATKLDVMMLSKITGHRDIKTLMRVYYAPDIGALADLLG
jgi:integrase